MKPSTGVGVEPSSTLTAASTVSTVAVFAIVASLDTVESWLPTNVTLMLASPALRALNEIPKRLPSVLNSCNAVPFTSCAGTT